MKTSWGVRRDGAQAKRSVTRDDRWSSLTCAPQVGAVGHRHAVQFGRKAAGGRRKGGRPGIEPATSRSGGDSAGPDLERVGLHAAVLPPAGFDGAYGRGLPRSR